MKIHSQNFAISYNSQNYMELQNILTHYILTKKIMNTKNRFIYDVILFGIFSYFIKLYSAF